MFCYTVSTINVIAVTIRVFSTPYCGFCTTLKEYLKQRNVAFTEVDLAQDPEQARYIVQLTGQAGVPVLLKEEEGKQPEFIVGYNKEKVDAMLGLTA